MSGVLRPAQAVLVSVLLVGTALAGCLGGDGIERRIKRVSAPVVDGDRQADEYWLVTVMGNETQEEVPDGVCSRIPQGFEIFYQNRSLVYEGERYGFAPDEVDTLLAFDHEDLSTQCPEAEYLSANPEGPVMEEMGEYGEIEIEVLANGTVLLDETRIPLGEAAMVSYEGTPAGEDKGFVEGSFSVRNHGAWENQNLWRGNPY